MVMRFQSPLVYVLRIPYLSNTHKRCLAPSIGVFYAWMNGYITLLHNIAPGKYIAIKVEIDDSCTYDSFNKSDEKKKKNNHSNAHEFGLYNTFNGTCIQVLMKYV